MKNTSQMLRHQFVTYIYSFAYGTLKKAVSSSGDIAGAGRNYTLFHIICNLAKT
jgi:hypothetical protein